MKPTADRMTIINDICAVMRKAIREELERQTRTCLNCLHWIDESDPFNPGECRLAGKRPPPSIIVTGCEQHDDEIPF